MEYVLGHCSGCSQLLFFKEVEAKMRLTSRRSTSSQLHLANAILPAVTSKHAYSHNKISQSNKGAYIACATSSYMYTT